MSSPAPSSASRSCSPRAGASPPHMVLLPSAGMGHLVPFTRLAVALSAGHGCAISLVTTLPTVSSAESRHLAALHAAFPGIRQLELDLSLADPFDASSEFPGADPFYARYEALRRSVPLLLPPLLAAGAGASSTLVADIALASVAIPVARELRIPCFVFFTESATMLSFKAYFPTHLAAAGHGGAIGDVDVPGVCRVPSSSVPQALHDPGDIFTRQFVANGRALVAADGLLVNAFRAMEPDAVDALQRGSVVVPGLPPVFAVGPLMPVTGEAEQEQQQGNYMAWLDEQPPRSVVYVSFGSRKALLPEQMKELAGGLEACGHRFLWVVKGAVVDRDDGGELGDLLGVGGEAFLRRVRGRGFVTKSWVEQAAVLRHPAVALFVSHCGWNSVTEAASSGVPVLAWPRFADQRVNARVVANAGLGVWDERWSWEGEEAVVTAEEIKEMVVEAMGDGAVAVKAAKVREAAARAVADGGSSYRSLAAFVRRCTVPSE